MVERDKICLRKRKIKRRGKIWSKNGVKVARNEGEIQDLKMEVLERERGR